MILNRDYLTWKLGWWEGTVGTPNVQRNENFTSWVSIFCLAQVGCILKGNWGISYFKLWMMVDMVLGDIFVFRHLYKRIQQPRCMILQD